jgi:hypothetical protein
MYDAFLCHYSRPLILLQSHDQAVAFAASFRKLLKDGSFDLRCVLNMDETLIYFD